MTPTSCDKPDLLVFKDPFRGANIKKCPKKLVLQDQ